MIEQGNVQVISTNILASWYQIKNLQKDNAQNYV